MSNNSNTSLYPKNFIEEAYLIYGMRTEGLLEIKFHYPKRKNAWTAETNLKLIEILRNANKDEQVKCVLIHGGEFYSSGNDLSGFGKAMAENPDKI